ncbi:drug/metabolite transporter (DMT)-like permease [Angulomicrobium tetraedrale]|uniref:Drug/metabolite transporter (DMT)-like permease n=1 Tax=Ancylobacter tetraedralis TaxID=217068 RepID=A0A839Z6V6_9HYPH|nr:DMT family transporter [Ancylobacter tetraedralis]MBB3770106.1 drug/metabolite transporter (DMT)-like permease [Ancylobacter tetraedralis]
MSPPPAAALSPVATDSFHLLAPLSGEAHEALLRRNAFLAAIAGAICIGFSAIFVRLADTGPAAIGFWRLLFALGPTAVWAYAEYRVGQARRRRAGAAGPLRLFTVRQFFLAAFAGLFFGADLIAFHFGLVRTTTANALLLGNLAVVFVLIFGWLCLGERPTRGLMAALVLALVGTALIISRSAGAHGGDAASLIGDAFCVVAAVSYGGYVIVTRTLRRNDGAGGVGLGGGMASFISSATGAIVCLVWAVATDEVIVPQSLKGLLAVVGLGLVAHAAGQGLTTVALGRLPAGLVSTVLLLQIVVGTSLAAMLFGEVPSLMVMIGGLMVVAGVVVARPPRTPA